jgi:homoserine kinase type II
MSTDKKVVVYVLWHSHRISKNNIQEKMIGVFATRKSALEAKRELKNKIGFKSYPNGFKVFRYEVGMVGWSEGFITV